MNQQRDLMRELTGKADPNTLPLSLDTDRIAGMVHDKLSSAEKGSRIMKFKTGKTLAVLIAAAALLALSVTAFAFSGIITAVNGYSSSNAEYLSLPDAGTCQKDAGYVPVLLEAFENGYVFQNGSLFHNELVGDGKTVVERYKGFEFTYTKAGDTVEFVQEKYQSEAGINPNVVKMELNGIELRYSSSIYKSVPLDYEPTEAEEAAEAAGTLSFGYSDMNIAVEEHTVQTLYWQIEDMHYILYQMDGALSANELAEMAGEIISACAN